MPSSSIDIQAHELIGQHPHGMRCYTWCRLQRDASAVGWKLAILAIRRTSWSEVLEAADALGRSDFD
jgi:hypothetical protein